MQLIDAHAHIFPAVDGHVQAGPTRGLGYGRIAMGAQTLQLIPPFNVETTYTVEMLLAQMDWAGVGRAFLLQGTYYGACNDYARAAIHHHPERLAGAAYLDPWQPGAREAFARAFDQPGFGAAKLEFSVGHGLWGLHPGAHLDDPDLEWLWQALQKRGLALTLDLGGIGTESYQTGAVEMIARRHPGLKIVVAHLGQPRLAIDSDQVQRALWLQQVDLGKLPNVWFDTAALPMFLRPEGYPFASAGRYLEMALERIGAHKVMWGSDQPGLFVVATYLQLVELARLHGGFLSRSEQAAYLGGTACQVYGM